MRMTTLGLLVVLVGAVGCNQANSEPATPPQVAIGIAIPSYVHAVAWIAADHGDFEAAGIDARVDTMGGSSATARSLLAGSSHVGLLGGDVVIKANAAGGDLVIVAGLVNRFYHRLIGRPGVRQLSDLRGGKIGLPFLGGPQDMAARYALRSHDMSYGKDVEILNLGRELNRIAALKRGDIDATMSQTPPSRLAKLGFTVLEDLPARDVSFPYMMVVVRRSYLRTHPERVRAAVRGLCRATYLYRTQPDAGLALIGNHLHGSDTAEAARERYRSSGPNLISWPPAPDPEGLKMVIDFLGPKKSGGLQPEALIDLTILDELRSQGECGGA